MVINQSLTLKEFTNNSEDSNYSFSSNSNQMVDMDVDHQKQNYDLLEHKEPFIDQFKQINKNIF